MSYGLQEGGGVYRPRHPQESPFYQLVERYYPQFEALYPERYPERYGFWRPVLGTVVGKFLDKTEHNAVGRFPEPGDETLWAGPSRNFQVFDPLDFLAACPP